MYFRGWVLHLNSKERQKRLHVESDKSRIPSRNTVDGKCHQAPWVCASLWESCTFTKQWRKQRSVFSAWIIHTFTISISNLFFFVYFAFCLIFCFCAHFHVSFCLSTVRHLLIYTPIHTLSICARYVWCECVLNESVFVCLVRSGL